MRKSLAMIGLPVLLGGCSLPPAISVASWAVDGVSYLVSGKSVTDHAISEVAQQDCALFRVVQEKDICVEFDLQGDDAAAMMADAGSALEDDADASPSDPLLVSPELAGLVAGFGPDTVRVESAPAVAALVPDTGRFIAATPKVRPVHTDLVDTRVAAAPLPAALPPRAPLVQSVTVIGSFKYADNAQRLADRMSAMNSAVMTVNADGRTWHRVVLKVSLAQAQHAGFEDAWILETCDDASSSGVCADIRDVSAPANGLQVAQAN